MRSIVSVMSRRLCWTCIV